MIRNFLVWIVVLLSLVSFVSAVGDVTSDIRWFHNFDSISGTTITDEEGNFSGTVSGNASNTTGISGNALNFDGNDLVQMPVGSFEFVSSFTISFWTKKYNTPYGYYIQSVNTASLNPGTLTMLIDNPAGNYLIKIDKGATAEEMSYNGLTLSATNWNQLTFVKDVSAGFCTAYKNGVQLKNISCASFVLGSIDSAAYANLAAGGANGLKGALDEFVTYDRALSLEDVELLYSCVTPSNANCSSTPVSDTINLSSSLPGDNSGFNSVPINFNVSGNFSVSSNCSLFINDSLNETKTNFLGVDQLVNFSVANFSNGFYDFYINCFNDNNSVNTSANSFLVDIVDPEISTSFLNNSIFYRNNVSAVINVTDDLYVFSLNVSIDGVAVFGQSNIGGGFFQYNLSVLSSDYSVGSHSLFIRAADGHTAKELKSVKDFKAVAGDKLLYDFGGVYKPLQINIYKKGERKGDKWSVEKKVDRFKEIYEPSVPSSSLTFVVESDEEVFFAESGDAYNGGWLIIGDHWKDFVLEDEPSAKLKFIKKNKHSFEVTVSGIKNKDRLVFSSTGDLNVNELNYTFFVVNTSERFNYSVLSGFSSDWFLNIDLGLFPDYLSYSPVAILSFNGSNYGGVLDSYSSLGANFSFSKVLGFVGDGSALVPHQWFFNISPLTQNGYNTSVLFQNQTNVSVGACGGSFVFPILNISYLDEVTNGAVNVSNVYDLMIWDGSYYYNLTGQFVSETSSSLCTNLNPSNFIYSWNLWGSFTMSSPSYITRLYTVDVGSPIRVSNNPASSLDLYMIRSNYSSTVTFSWLTTSFQQFDGTMKIYRCNNDSTRSLVDSQNIINGLAFANLQLFFTSYSYEVLIAGVTYTDAWTDCHIEAATERELLVNLDEVNILPVVGLFLVDCSLSNVSNQVTMSWSANPEDTSSILACIVGKRQSIYNQTEVYRNCSSAVSGSFTVGVPSLPNSYFVSGEITQNGYKGYCQQTLVFDHSRSEVSTAFGFSGVLAVVIMMLSFALMFAGNGEKQVFGAVGGVLVGFVLGLISLPWPVVSAVIFLGIVVVVIGRYTKFGSVF